MLRLFSAFLSECVSFAPLMNSTTNSLECAWRGHRYCWSNRIGGLDTGLLPSLAPDGGGNGHRNDAVWFLVSSETEICIMYFGVSATSRDNHLCLQTNDSSDPQLTGCGDVIQYFQIPNIFPAIFYQPSLFQEHGSRGTFPQSLLFLVNGLFTKSMDMASLKVDL